MIHRGRLRHGKGEQFQLYPFIFTQSYKVYLEAFGFEAYIFWSRLMET